MQTLTFVSLLGAVLAVFFALRLGIQATENRPAALAFAAFLVSAAFFLLDEAGIREGFFVEYPWLFGLADPAILAIGPCFFLYACATTQPAFAWRARHTLHFIGPILLVPLTGLLLAMPLEDKVRFAEEARRDVLLGGPLAFADQVVLAFFDAYHLGYLGAAWWRLWRWRERVAEEQEEGRSHPLRGIGLFATLVLAIGAISAALDFSPWAGRGGTITALACVLALFALLWLTTQPRPFLPAAQVAEIAPVLPEPPEPAPAPSGKTPDPVLTAEPSPPLPPPPAPPGGGDVSGRSHTLRPEELALLVKRVRRALDEDRVFLDPDLSLVVLAARAKTTRHKLSAALRQGFGATFHQLVSRYRVTEAARVLDTPEGRARTIADVAFGAGFNTLSAFNAAFRAHFGLTPSAYRDRKRTSGHGG